jgi:hypothetical protein
MVASQMLLIRDLAGERNQVNKFFARERVLWKLYCAIGDNTYGIHNDSIDYSMAMMNW